MALAWTNLFDIGECVVTVHTGGSFNSANGPAMTAEEMTLAGVTLEIVEGVITLSAPNGSGFFEVRVTPAFDPGGAAVRLVNVGVDDGIGIMPNSYPTWSPAPHPSIGEIYVNSHDFAPTQAWTFAGTGTPTSFG